MTVVSALLVTSPVYAATLTAASWTATPAYVSSPNATYNYGFTTASTATLSRAQMTVPPGTRGVVGTRYLDMNGSTGNYASTPDSAANSITGDIEIRAHLAPTHWATGSTQNLVSKWQSTSVRSYRLALTSLGNLAFNWTTDGTTTQTSTSSPTALSDGTAAWVRVTMKVNNGSGDSDTTFYTSNDGVSWTQLGLVQHSGSTTSLADTAAVNSVGADGSGGAPLAGKIYYAEVRNGISGTVANKFDPNDSVVGSTSWPASTGETWTVNRTGTNLPADVASDLTVTSVTGLPSTGTARVRTIDKTAIYLPTTPASVALGTVATVSLSGFTNTQTPGNYTSTISTYDNSATPAAVDTATTTNLLFVTPIAAGDQHACALSTAGQATCWGLNVNGQLGDGTQTQRTAPTAVSGGRTFAAVATGQNHTCALTSAGAAYCWGYNTSGQIGDGTASLRTTPTAVSGGLTFSSIATGQNHTCALTSAGAAYCWGYNGYGQLGDGTATNRSAPTAVPGGLTFASISTGWKHTCGITTSGLAYCWGGNGNGQLGDTTTTDRSSPTAVSTTLKFMSITGGASHSCALVAAGAPYCWGSNSNGRIGDGTFTQRTTPTAVSTSLTFVSVAADFADSCGVTTAGSAYCWGDGRNGQIGDGGISQRTVPTVVSGALTFSAITGGTYFACGVSSTTANYCWGDNSNDQIGSVGLVAHVTPTAVSTALVFASISVGVSHSCGLTSAGAAYCWGYNSNGQLGDGTSTQRTSPTAVSGGLTFTSIAAGLQSSCGLVTGGTAYCWGYNGNGQVGDGTTATRLVPTSTGSTFTSIANGVSHTCGLTSTGAAYCWGSNSNGQIGDGTTTDRTSPTAVSGGLTFTALAGGNSHTCGLSSGSAYCWGNNGNGQLGDTTTAQRTAPTAVSGGLSFTSISGGWYYTCGLISGGTAYCWGQNPGGQLGDGTTTQRTAPTSVSGGLTFASISPGQYHTCALTSAGVAYCWGYNGNGRLGDGTTTNRTAPTAVSTAMTYTAIAAGGYHTCATRTAAVAQCWGNNSNAQIGDGTAATRSLTPAYVDSAPGTPSSLAQTKTDSTNLVTGAWTNETTVRFTGSATDPDTVVSDTTTLCVEVKPVGTSFTNTTTCGSAVASGGSATVSITGLSTNVQYHWQAQSKDSYGAYSSWTSYDTNAESAADFGVDTTAPSLGTVYDGTTAGIETVLNSGSLSTLSANWSSFADAGSGVASYDYAVGTTPGATDLRGWTSAGSLSSVDATGLSLHTSAPYYLSVRARDAVGNVSVGVSSSGQQVAPSLTYSASSSTLNFGHLAAGQTGTASVTLTTSTNAYGGYKVYASMPTGLTSAAGGTISVFNGGTYAAPNSMQPGNTGVGYTSSDVSVNGANIFQPTTCLGGSINVAPGCLAPFNVTGPGDVAADTVGPIAGTPITNQTFTITVQIVAPITQVPGTYSAPIRFSVVPVY